THDLRNRGRRSHGCLPTNESLLERITRKLRDGWKRLIDILNQPGVPKNG
ncbi:protease FtsH-inhibitory lysogeny factor CIII, partial [Escherichia coli]|nr:protease FtsH-inhibitory lysogeny factor CIII [Escherichia coli]